MKKEEFYKECKLGDIVEIIVANKSIKVVATMINDDESFYGDFLDNGVIKRGYYKIKYVDNINRINDGVIYTN